MWYDTHLKLTFKTSKHFVIKSDITFLSGLKDTITFYSQPVSIKAALEQLIYFEHYYEMCKYPRLHRRVETSHVELIFFLFLRSSWY